MRTTLRLLGWVTVAIAAACGGDKPKPVTPADPAPAAESPVCAEIGTLLEAARASFDPSTVVTGAVACRVIPGEAPYPDAFECELAAPESEAKAQEVLDRWAADLATCPQLSTYKASTNSLGQAWVLELEDNHTLEVQLSTSNEANTLPTLTVRMNEI